MAHRINPLSLQLKYHGSWNLAWSQYIRKDFSYFFFIEAYLKSITESIKYLKGFLNRFFFYELNFFFKEDTILFFFSLRFISKTSLKFYWSHRYPFYNFKKSLTYTEKTKKFITFLNSYKKKVFFKLSFWGKTKLLNNNLFSLKKTKIAFPYDFFIRKKTSSFKIINFNLTCFFFKKQVKLKLIILNELVFLRMKKSYGKAILVFFNTIFFFLREVFKENFINKRSMKELLCEKKLQSFNEIIFHYKKKFVKLFVLFNKLKLKKRDLLSKFRRRPLDAKTKRFLLREKKRSLYFIKYLRYCTLSLTDFIEIADNKANFTLEQLVILKKTLEKKLTKPKQSTAIKDLINLLSVFK